MQNCRTLKGTFCFNKIWLALTINNDSTSLKKKEVFKMDTELINYPHGFAKIEKIFSKGFDEKTLKEIKVNKNDVKTFMKSHRYLRFFRISKTFQLLLIYYINIFASIFKTFSTSKVCFVCFTRQLLQRLEISTMQKLEIR